mmetsp:Transcript_32534/g.46243  ORF Transcript_32534/g.46243 Transcript_32534/m.46243 type:complete len:90 (+) Transcript_32534:1037-1306(+)
MICVGAMKIAKVHLPISLKPPSAVLCTGKMKTPKAVLMSTANCCPYFTTHCAIDLFAPVDCSDDMAPIAISYLHFRGILATVVVGQDLP